jgi:hypothetical protein
VAPDRFAFVAQICEVHTLKVGDTSVLSSHVVKIPIKERAARRPPFKILGVKILDSITLPNH